MKLRILPISIMLLFSTVTGCTNSIPKSTGDFVAPDDIEIYDPFKNNSEMKKRSRYSKTISPSTGDVNILVIPAHFSDVGEIDNSTRKDLEYVFNGNSKNTGWESLNSYFKASSFGALNVKATIAKDSFLIPMTALEMNNQSATTTSHYVQEAVSWYKNKYNDDCKRFDADHDGNIDTVMLIYSAKDYSEAKYEGDGENLWAYCYATYDSPNMDSPTPNTYFWASYDFMYGSNYIDVDAHTFIHEFGHCMGLPDYYNYDRDSKSNPLGGFDMQCYNVGDHNSYSKFTYEWSKPYVVNGDATITIKKTNLYKNNFIIIPYGGYDNWNKSAFDEYLMLEYYSPTGMNEFDSYHQTYPGYPRGPKGTGVKLTHVDARVIGTKYNQPYYVDYVDGVSRSYDVAATNTTVGGGKSRISPMEEAQDYKLIEVISKTNERRFEDGGYFLTKDLFVEGDTFSMSEYASMFFHEGYLNEKLYDADGNENGYASLGISFEITKLTDSYVTIKFTKD